MEENIIECRNLTHYYGSRMIYENLSFSVPRGRILGLLGKNGTGKTTTINILSGYLQPRSGECLIFGEDIQRMDPLTRRRIALLIEGHVQYAFMTVEDCIIMEYGSILIQKPVPQLLDTVRRYTVRLEAGAPETLPVDGKLYHSAVIRGSGETYSFADEAYVGGWLTRSGIAYSDLKSEKMNLEDAFIGLTGKY